jgi:RNA polymerase II subunit A C-terminal domain phosphatase
MSEKTDHILAPNKLKIHKWKVREGFYVTPGQIVLLYETPDDPATTGIHKLKSTKAGIVFERLVKEGQTCDEGQPIVSLRECSHTTVIKDLCAECGADLQQNEDVSLKRRRGVYFSLTFMFYLCRATSTKRRFR